MEVWAACRGHAVVVVAGDVGRSPRMQYHALSLAREVGCAVTLVGYGGEACCEAVLGEGRIREVRVEAVVLPGWVPGLVGKALKLVLLVVVLGRGLWVARRARRADVVLCQTPPAIPSLFLAWLCARVDGGVVVGDWHNLGFSVVEDGARRTRGLAPGAPLGFRDRSAAAAYRALERASGRLLDGHLCVTAAMAAWLAAHFGVAATPAHDRPPDFFRELGVEDRKATLRRVGAAGLFSRATPGEARFWGTAADLGDAVYDANCRPRAGRPAVAISSTSWSPDEDFTTLVDALAAYDASALRSLPKLVVIVTGKGPLKAQFLAEVARRSFTRVLAKTAWLPAADYAAALAAADLGVCLHSSTSGLDLPMKVVDMFGARLPVAALRFDCVDELVKDGENGLLFDDAKSLNAVFEALLADVDANAQLADLKRGVRVQERWDAMWRRAVLPVVGRAFASAAKAP